VEQQPDTCGPTLSGHRPTPLSALRVPRSSPSDTVLDAPSLATRPATPSEITAHTALEASALARTRILAGSMMALSLVGAAVALSFEGDPLAKQLAAAAMACLFGAHAFMWVRARGPELDQTPLAYCVYLPMCLAIAVANFAFGLLSPFGIAVAIGLLIFASSWDRTLASAAFATILVAFALSALSVRFGLYTRPPLAAAVVPRQWMWDVGILIVMLMYTTAHLAGRQLRSDQEQCVEKLERALHESAARQALLREARDAFQRVAGVGSPGRFSDQELDGFRLGGVLGRGGMGEVYAAERLSDGRKAALKLMRSDALGDRALLARFEREARIVASLRSPHVVEVLATSDAESVLPYIAMERLEGVDLGGYLRERECMTLLEVVELISQVAVGLSAAQAAHVVHRDLKPSNLFRSGADERPTWKILDFGVARCMDAAETTLTAVDLVGTPHYMAPEQVRGHALDHRTDVYALSAIAYRALTGEAPFAGAMPGVLKNILEDTPTPPSSLLAIPRAIDYVLAIGLAKAPEKRFQSAFELAAAFSMAATDHLSGALTRRAKELLRDS
jgi:eukaryotic-like serine/threonine-protein kinase